MDKEMLEGIVKEMKFKNQSLSKSYAVYIIELKVGHLVYFPSRKPND